jgi:hypothetical protein
VRDQAILATATAARHREQAAWLDRDVRQCASTCTSSKPLAIGGAASGRVPSGGVMEESLAKPSPATRKADPKGVPPSRPGPQQRGCRAPDLNLLPSWFEAPRGTPSDALIKRPAKCRRVPSCTSDWRITTLTMPPAPRSRRSAKRGTKSRS